MMFFAPGFWWRRPGWEAALLSPLAAAVGALTLRRMARSGAQVPVPVVCVGNPTVGGAGKTPTAVRILEQLQAGGAHPFALLRGHGGAVVQPMRVDPQQHDANAVGDEALLLARQAPTVVAGADRAGGARLAVAEGATHIVMDDGFQNPGLVKDVSILVVDAAVGVGNAHVLPAGPLRAPLWPQVERADAVLLMGEGPAGAALELWCEHLGHKVIRGRLVPDPAALETLRGQALNAFAGIGRPEKFFTTLEQAGLKLRACTPFADHHRFSRQEISALVREAEAAGARLVTTTKDMARLSTPDLKDLAASIAVLPVTLELEDPAALTALLALAEARAAARWRGAAAGGAGSGASAARRAKTDSAA